MFLLLVGCGVVYLILGDAEEAMMLLGFVFVVMGITFYQERKTERALEALRDLSSPRALVVRDGEQRRIPGREVVRGDVLILAEGDRVPADAVVLSCTNLSVEESLLTGESVPVEKVPWDGKTGIGRPGGEGLPFVYSGTLVVQGQGVCEVLARRHRDGDGQNRQGTRSGSGRENSAPARDRPNRQAALGRRAQPLRGRVRRLWPDSRELARGGPRGHHAGHGDAARRVPRGPDHLPRVGCLADLETACPHAAGARGRDAGCGDGALLRQDGHAHDEPDGRPTRRCRGEQSVELSDADGSVFPQAFHEVIEFGILASRPDPFDPMERAFLRLRDVSLAGTEHVHSDWMLVREYPLSSTLLAMSQVWESPRRGELCRGGEGGPGSDRRTSVTCRTRSGPTSTRRVVSMAADGLRVLGVARRRTNGRPSCRKGNTISRSSFSGSSGLPTRSGRPCRRRSRSAARAGIRVVMITGDHPATASAIAQQVGLGPADEVVTGRRARARWATEAPRADSRGGVFARVVPEQKLRIVNALKADGEVVAMTGDGVNDAPALKAAHIGIAMGERGTDVAREASRLVLLDDDFSSIVQAVRLGRRVYDNLRRRWPTSSPSTSRSPASSLFPLCSDCRSCCSPCTSCSSSSSSTRRARWSSRRRARSVT